MSFDEIFSEGNNGAAVPKPSGEQLREAAKGLHDFYAALVSGGFTEGQAMALIALAFDRLAGVQ